MGMPPQEEEREDVFVDRMEVHNPELGRLEHRIGKMYLDELFEDSGVDLEETAYWFHTPPGGWSSEPLRMKPALEAPITFPEPNHLEEDVSQRVPFEELREGSIVTGVISDMYLYHGLQIDFGATSDGLVPITVDQYMEDGLRNMFDPGQQVTARIFKLRQPGLYRWPVQLQLVEPAAAVPLLSPPEEYTSPIDHGWCTAQGMSVDDICAATNRHYAASQFLVGEDPAFRMGEMEQAYGYDHPDNLPLDEEKLDEEDERDTAAGPMLDLAASHMLAARW